MTLAEGLFVTHAIFGPGRVVALSGSYVWVYFPDVSGSAKDAVKKLVVDRSQLTETPGLKDARLDHVPVKLVNGILEFPKSSRISHNDAIANFLSEYPNGFADSKLIDSELRYKREATALFQKLLGNGRGRALLAEEQSDEIASAINDLFHATNIPALQEILAVRDGLRNCDAAGTFLAQVLDFIEAPGANSFQSLVDAVSGLPAEKGRARVLTWPVVTLLPFLADPERFIILKPTMTKTAAERLFFDLGYDSSPNWSTYERTLAFATSLRELLKPYGARDFIDVQSFIWVTAGAPAMRERDSN